MSDGGPTQNPLRPSSVEMADKNDDNKDDEVEVKKVFKKKKYFAGFKPYEDRGCTDCLCLLIFLLFVMAWFGLFGFAVAKGKPEVLYRATDYKGNVCGKYLNVDNSFEKGTAPKDKIEDLKYGVMPRLVDDLMSEAYRASSSMSLMIPVITTQCAKECPPQGAVFCSYEFLQRMNDMVGGQGAWANNPITETRALALLQKNMGFTTDLNRFTIAITGMKGALDAACLQASKDSVPDSASFTQTPREFCADVFQSCDRIVIATKPLLGRCVPTFKGKTRIVTQRCVDPVYEEADKKCNATGTFDVTCYDGKQTVYQPVQQGTSQSRVLSNEDLKKCLRMEERDETVEEKLPQANILTQVTKAATSFSSYISAVQKAWLETFVCGLIVPMIVGFVFLYIIKKFAGCIVWTCIIILEICFIAGAIIALAKAQVIKMPETVTNAWQSGTGGNSTFAPVDNSDEIYYQIGGWILLGCSVVFLCLIIFLKSAIDDAIRVVKISATAVASNFSVMLWPLFSFFWIGAASALFCLIGVLLMASGDMVAVAMKKSAANITASVVNDGNSSTVDAFPDITVMKTDDIVKYLGFFDLFMYFWVSEFIQAISIYTIGGAVAEWYFAPKDQGADEEGTVDSRSCCQKLRGNGGVCGAFCASIRSHPGTAAFGACIIAVVKAFKYFVAYLMNQMNRANPESRIVKCLTCIVMCCLQCFERSVKYLSKNAYLYSTIKGTTFCWSSYKSFIILWNNFARFGAKGLSSSLVMLFGKLSIMMLSTLCAYYMVGLNGKYNDVTTDNYISSMGQFIICVVVLSLSYVVAEVFFSVYDTATDSIMLCYCFDITEAGGECFEDKMGYKLPMKKTKEADDADDAIEEEKNKKFCCCCGGKKTGGGNDGGEDEK